MSRPDKCRWCGCAEIISDGFPEIDGGREVLFACGSVWYEAAMGWVRDPLQCGGQAGRLYKRIADAVEATQQASRFDLVAGRHGGIDAEPDSAGCYAWASVLDDIAAILQGNSPEIPEGSP